MTLFRHILVPVDGSKHAGKALRFALALAREVKAQVDVLHVIDTASMREISRFLGREPTQVQVEAQERAKGILADAESVAREAGVAIGTHLALGVPYEAIIDEARRLEVDLIVMGRVGTRGPRRILLGSVTARVMEIAPCHLLVTR